MATPWLSDRQQSVWRQWLRATTELPLALNRQLQQDAGMSLQDFEVLVHLSEAPEQRQRIGALADQTTWERSRLSHHLRRMETRGLVRREDCAEDARGSVVVLTEQGREAIETAAPGHAEMVRTLMFDGLSDAELDSLDLLTSRIARRIADPGRPRLRRPAPDVPTLATSGARRAGTAATGACPGDLRRQRPAT